MNASFTKRNITPLGTTVNLMNCGMKQKYSHKCVELITHRFANILWILEFCTCLHNCKHHFLFLFTWIFTKSLIHLQTLIEILESYKLCNWMLILRTRKSFACCSCLKCKLTKTESIDFIWLLSIMILCDCDQKFPQAAELF